MCRYQDGWLWSLLLFCGTISSGLTLEHGLAELCSHALPSIKEPPNIASFHPQVEKGKLIHLKDKMQTKRSLSLAFPACHFCSFLLFIRIRSPDAFRTQYIPFPQPSPFPKAGKNPPLPHGSLLVATHSRQFLFWATQQLKIFLSWENTKFCESWGKRGEGARCSFSPHCDVKELAWSSDTVKQGQLQGLLEPAEAATSIQWPPVVCTLQSWCGVSCTIIGWIVSPKRYWRLTPSTCEWDLICN